MKVLDKLNPIIRDIQHYFGFLFDRGFEIQESKVGLIWPLNWSLMLRSEREQCDIRIWSDRDEIFLAFRRIYAPSDKWMGLEPTIYYLSKGQTFVGKFEGNLHDRKGQLARLSILLREHIDQILPEFQAVNYSRHHDELLRAGEEYLEMFMKKYVPGWNARAKEGRRH